MARLAASYAVVALFLIASACSGERPTLGAPAPSVASSPTPGDPCDPGAARGELVSSAAVALDGDGVDDTMQVLRIDDRTWTVRVERTSGPAVEGVLEVDPLGVDVAGAIGGADVDGDGVDELLSVVGTGGDLLVVAVHVLVGCELVPVGVGGEPVAFPVGADTTTAASLECVDAAALAARSGDGAASGDLAPDAAAEASGGGLVASVAGRDGQGWTLDEVAWRLVGSELQPLDGTTARVDAAVVEALPALECGDLEAPLPR